MATIIKKPNGSYKAIVRRVGMTTLTKTHKKKAVLDDWVRAQETRVEHRRAVGEHKVGAILTRHIHEIIDAKGYESSAVRAHLTRAARITAEDYVADIDSTWWVNFGMRFNVQKQSRARYMSEVAGALRSAEEMKWIGAINWRDYTDAKKMLARRSLLGKKKHRDRRVSDEEMTALLAEADARMERATNGDDTRKQYSSAIKRACAAAWKGGMSRREIAKKFGIVSVNALHDWTMGKHLGDDKPTRPPYPMRDLIEFACELGMRCAEITRLRFSDLSGSERDKMILVRDRKHNTEKIGNDWLIPLLGKSYEIIKRQPRRTKEEAAAIGVDADLIFPYDEQTIGAYFRQMCKRCGIVNLHFHDLRHEGISRLFEQGYLIQEVALVSGHRDWASLKIYANIKPKDLHRGPAARRAIPLYLLQQHAANDAA